jgi:hypothetical protein
MIKMDGPWLTELDPEKAMDQRFLNSKTSGNVKGHKRPNEK